MWHIKCDKDLKILLIFQRVYVTSAAEGRSQVAVAIEAIGSKYGGEVVW